MPNNKRTPVLQDWVCELNFKQQTGLISAIRGVDNCPQDEYKTITRMLRYIILRNADKNTGFMTSDIIPTEDTIKILEDYQALLDKVTDLDKLSNAIPDLILEDGMKLEVKVSTNINEHWLDHIRMAIRTIAQHHPNSYIKAYWGTVYNKISKG